MEDSHSGREAEPRWEGHKALFQAADDDAFHDLKIEFRTLKKSAREGRSGSGSMLTSCRPSTRSLSRVNK